MSHVQTEKTHKQFKRMGQQQNIYYATVCIKKMLYISAIPQMSTPVIWDDLTVCYDILLSLSLLDLQYLSWNGIQKTLGYMILNNNYIRRLQI